MGQVPFPFELGVQILLPKDYHSYDFLKKLELIRDSGFTSVELNILKPGEVDPYKIKKTLSDNGLNMSSFASGATANAEGLSLSTSDEALRSRSVQRVDELIDFARIFKAGIILGFLKGNPTHKEEGKAKLSQSIGELKNKAEQEKTALILEATNRYESKVANSLEDTFQIIEEHNSPYVHMLPDTFHMNIEERSMLGAIKKYMGYFKTLHISDNNRYFPGYGCLNFSELIHFLVAVGYDGILTIEGNVKHDFETDLRMSSQYLHAINTG